MKKVSFFLLLFVMACQNSNESSLSISSNDFQDSFDKAYEESSLYLISKDEFALVQSSQRYAIKARLYDEKSVLVLHSHFEDFNKSDGIRIFVERKDKILQIFFSSPNHSKQLLFEDEDYFNDLKTVFFIIEVSNEWADRYIKIDNVLSYHFSVIKTYKELGHLPYNLTSSKDKKLTVYSPGKGRHWGLHLKKSELISARRF